jgi:hypothetical protein
MGDVIYKGFYQALADGSLETTPDVRLLLVMSGFTGETEEDAINLADITSLDEFDGIGYGRLDLANVTTGYVDADDEWQLDADDGDFGDPVAPGSDVIYGLVAYLHVDGTAANDVILGFTDSGGFGINANNGPLNIVLPAGGLLFVRQAA